MGSNVFMRNPFWSASRSTSRTGLVILTGFTAALGGCSADVARFDFGHNALNDRTTTASIPTPSEPMRRSNLLGDDSPVSSAASQPSGQISEGGAYIPPASNRAAGANPSGVKMAALPDVAPPQAPAHSVAVEAPRANFAPVTAAPAAVDAKGELIEVQPGDTLFKLSKRHQVAVAELMSVNSLSGPNLKPGQKLYLPSNRAALKPLTRTPAAAVAAAAPVDLPADWKGSYTVKSGDALYTIARQNRIKPEDLQRYNGITDVRKVKPGMVLHMPGTDGPASTGTSASVTPPPEAVKDAVAAATPPGTESSSAPKLLNGAPDGNQKVAFAAPPSPTANDATPAAKAVATAPEAAAVNGKLRWPVQGKIISNFGQRPDGTHNDGVNLAVPMGTEVHAAEEGLVAYAGSELKGYGNLILLRHDNGWVTAYAHSDELLVKRGDRVKRGQVIAKAGKSGSVDQPQVHFEVRQGQKPVDPAPYMDKI